MSEEHKLSPFFKRRIDHHKFEKMMRKGIIFMYHESSSLEEFKFKLVKATLENYIHYKYNIDIEELPHDDVDNFIDYMVDTYEPVLKMYYYNERKNNGNINENYSPAGKEIMPNKIVIHISNPKFRDRISNEGLKARAGECYKIYAGYGEKCIPAIFATNSTNKKAWFDSTYDDDIWAINTEMIPDVKWYKDRHFESYKKHIVTFDNIPSESIELIHEGTGGNMIRESIDKSEDKKLKFVTQIIHEFFDEVSFIEIKKYQNKPLIRVYFDNDGDASNEESYFAEQIQDKIYQYTGIKLLPYWQLEQYSTDSDFRLDAIKLKYDDEGNVINESEENKKEKNSNYLEMIKELIEPFKKEDCVCNIKVSFDDDMYDIYLEFGTEELNDKFYSSVGKNHYVKNLKINVKNTIKNYLSIDNLYVGSYGTPRCGWTKN